MSLTEWITPDRIVELSSRARFGAIEELVRVVAKSRSVGDPAALLAAIRERESILSTGIGLGLAVPHAKIASVTDFALALGRSREGIDFDAIDGKPVHIVVLIAASDLQQAGYVRLLAHVVKHFKLEAVRRAVLEAADAASIHAALRDS